MAVLRAWNAVAKLAKGDHRVYINKGSKRGKHDLACKGEPDHDSPEHDVWDEASAIACHEEADAAYALFATVPTTAVGIAAASRFAKEREERAEIGDVEFLKINRADGDGDLTLLFLTSLCTALERIGLARAVVA